MGRMGGWEGGGSGSEGFVEVGWEEDVKDGWSVGGATWWFEAWLELLVWVGEDEDCWLTSADEAVGGGSAARGGGRGATACVGW
jgi:hypothetical protein